MANWTGEGSAHRRMVRDLLLKPVEEGANLMRRLREGRMFRSYVRKRSLLVVLVSLVFLASSIAFAGATVMFFFRGGSLLTFVSLILAPIILIVSLLVQTFVFFFWIENRAVEQSLKGRGGHGRGAISRWLKRRLGLNMGRMPPVPWGYVVIFVLSPLAMLASVAPPAAIAVIGAGILAPIVYARLDN